MKRTSVCADVHITCGEMSSSTVAGTENKNKYNVMRFLAALAGVLGSFFTFVTATDHFMLLNEPVLAVVCTVVWAVSCFVMSAEGKAARIAEIAVSALTGIAVLITAGSVVKGGGEIAVHIGSYVRGDGVESPLMTRDASTALCVIAALVTLLVCFFTIKRPNLPMVVMLTVPLPEI
ncbi:MAG: hypothetical protein ILP19_09150, partial [Oscillospiraceae bacterium]|nr:hypothetical protein [Oscillospiraceae bacterium]